MRIKYLMVGCLTGALAVNTYSAPLLISDFEIGTGGEVGVVATNTLDVTRYALQATPELGGPWSNKQFRLARADSQVFETQLPPDSEKGFFRVVEDPFETLESGSVWKRFTLSSGDPTYWMTSDLNFLEGGTGVLSSIRWSLTAPPPSSGVNIVSISADGSVSDLYSDVVQMSLDANLVVSLFGTSSGGMDIIPRTGGSGFVTADLEGQWRFFELTAEAGSGGWAGWMTSDLSFTSGGVGTWSSIQRSDGDSSNPGSFTFSVFDDGSVSDEPNGPFLQMSLDRNLNVFVLNDPGQVGMGVMLRSGGSGFETSDLEGRWKMLTITVADSPGDYTGWFASDLDFTAGGVGTWSSVQRSDGSTDAPPTITLSIADNGSISGGPPGSIWGMSLDKDMMTWVMSDGGGGINFGIILRN